MHSFVDGKGQFFDDGKGKPLGNAEGRVWYHGTPLVLATLAAGSSITRNRELAVAFSHRPTRIDVSDDGAIRDNGTAEGYLYEVDEPVAPDDIHPHPACKDGDPWELVTHRPLRLRLIQKTPV